MIDDIVDEKNPFKDIGTEEICIEDDLFDNNNTETITDVSKDIVNETKQKTDPFIDFRVNDSTLKNDNTIETIITDEDDESPETIKIRDDITIETMIIDDIEIPSTDNTEIDNGLPSCTRIITTSANQIRLAAERIKKNTENKNLPEF